MEKKKVGCRSIEEYIAQFSPEIQERLESIRETIKDAAPEAEERISYQMPAFALHGILVYFAACKKHIGFYPTSSGVESFKDELSGYKLTKGSIHFPFDKPIPHELITKIVKFRVAENQKKDGSTKAAPRS